MEAWCALPARAVTDAALSRFLQLNAMKESTFRTRKPCMERVNLVHGSDNQFQRADPRNAAFKSYFDRVVEADTQQAQHASAALLTTQQELSTCEREGGAWRRTTQLLLLVLLVVAAAGVLSCWAPRWWPVRLRAQLNTAAARARRLKEQPDHML